MTTLHFILVAAAFLCLALAGFGIKGEKLELPWIAAALLVLALLLIPAGEAL